MRTVKACLIPLLILLAASPLLAQSLTGAISGTVSDEQGGVLPGVTVTLTGKTGSRTATTDHLGVYRFPAVEPGGYEVRAELSGFQTRREANVAISIGKQLEIDFLLKITGVTEAIEVVAESPVVDTTSTATANTISQDLLFNMPLNRTASNLLNYAPGINDDDAYGQGFTASGLLLDGVDTRDPEGGTAWTFVNYNIIEEIQVQGLGAPAEYGAFTGALVNTISRSGGNNFAALFDANWTTGSLASKNITPEISQANPTLESQRTKQYLDVTTQLSGPIIKDKLFFFASLQRFKYKFDPTGPRTFRDELSHRGNFKLTYQPNPGDVFTATLQLDDYSIRGRSGFDPDIDTDQQSVDEDAPEAVWNFQWRHLFGSKTFFEAKYLGWWGYYYLDPVDTGPRFYDGSTNTVSGGAGNFYYADRGRHEVQASLSHYAEAFGHHDLKFGVQIERSRVRSRYGYPAGVDYYDYTAYYPTGQYSAYSYGYDVSGRNHRESFYAQDSWRPSDRLTINAGLRLDLISGSHPTAGKVFDTKSLAPRLGFAWDVTGDHTTVLKGSYSQYYEAALFSFYSRATPGLQDYVIYFYDGESQEPGGPPGFYEDFRTPISTVFSVNPDIKHPRVDEFTLGFERALSRDFRLSVTGVWRENRNLIDSVFPDARWEPVTLEAPVDDGPFLGNTYTVYRWANRDDSWTNGLITNPDSFRYLDPDGNVLGTANAYRKYKALMFVLSKRFTNRWQAQVSYVLSNAKGTVDNWSYGSSAGISRQFETPQTAFLNADGTNGSDRKHEVKVFASYQIPRIDVGVNVYYRYLTGLPYNSRMRFSGDDRRELDLPLVPSAWRTVLAEPRGSQRLDNQSLLDLRIEKIFRVGKDRFAVYADIANVFNSTVVDSVYTRIEGTTVGTEETGFTDLPFGGPTSVIAPRQITFGARWSF